MQLTLEGFNDPQMARTQSRRLGGLEPNTTVGMAAVTFILLVDQRFWPANHSIHLESFCVT